MAKKLRISSESKFAFKQTIPVLAGYLFLGMAFGLMLENIGFHAGWAFLTSFLIYAGSMQFVLVSILASAGSILSVILLTLSVNGRHFFYAFPFLESFRKMGKKFPYMVFSLTDETYALLYSVKIPENISSKKVYFRISLFNHLYWIVGSTLGGLIGQMIKFNLEGIDFAMTALFTVILVEQVLVAKLDVKLAILTGLVLATVSLLIFGPDKFILPALIATLAVLILLRPLLLKTDKKTQAKEEGHD